MHGCMDTDIFAFTTKCLLILIVHIVVKHGSIIHYYISDRSIYCTQYIYVYIYPSWCVCERERGREKNMISQVNQVNQYVQ